MSTLYESYGSGEEYGNKVWDCGGVHWVAQTFLTTSGHLVNRIRILVEWFGQGDVNDIYISLRAVDGDDKPTGDDLAVGHADGNSLTGTAEWFAVDLDSAITLADATTYAIVVRAPDSAYGVDIGLHAEGDGSLYPNGHAWYSLDSGSTGSWIDYSYPINDQDCYFEIWHITIPPTVATLDAANITYQGAELWGGLTHSADYPSNTCGFEYGKTPSFGSSVESGAYTKTTEFHAPITGLEQTMVYYFRAYATYNGTTVYGDMKYFVTNWTNPENQSGFVWIEGTKFHYLDAAGVEHAVAGV